MATALTWTFDLEGRDPADALARAERVLQADRAFRGPWRAGDQPAETRSRMAALSLWRLLGQTEIEEPVDMWLGSMPTESGACLSWTIVDAGPFCAVTDASGVPTEHPFHRRTSANAELCTQLAFELVKELGPRCAKACTDAGAAELWNAHVLYWRDEECAARDLAAFGAAQRSDVLESQAGHTWRTEEQRNALSEQLARLPMAKAPTAARITALLASERFDVYRLEPGFAVLEHPWYVNAFIDRFVFEAFGL